MLIEDYLADLKIPFDALLFITNKMFEDFYEYTYNEIKENPQKFSERIIVYSYLYKFIAKELVKKRNTMQKKVNEDLKDLKKIEI